MSYIRFENIVKSFGSNTVLKDINLEVEKGQLVTLLGPSGCGKSTLLRCLAGLETVTSGKVYLDNKDITDVNPKDRDIGMVFQQYSLFPNMDVAQNVAFGLKMKKVPNAEIDKRVKEMVDIVGLSDHLHHYPSEMSGGQQQRLCIARALAVQPEVLLMDEPTSALDPISTSKIEELAMELKKDYTIVMVTHNMQQATRISDKTAFFLLGEVVEFDDTDKLFSMPSDKRTEDYITGRFG